MDREDLATQFAALSTTELLEIVDRKFDYTELAVTIALEEIARRNVSEEDIKGYKEQQIAKVKTFISKNYLDDLHLSGKIFFFFIWIPLLNFPFRQNFRDDDYILKLKQARYYSLMGFIFIMLTGLGSGLYNLSNLTAFTIWFLSFLPAYAIDESLNRKRLIRRLNAMFSPPQQSDTPIDPPDDESSDS